MASSVDVRLTVYVCAITAYGLGILDRTAAPNNGVRFVVAIITLFSILIPTVNPMIVQIKI